MTKLKIIVRKGWVNVGVVSELKERNIYPKSNWHDRVYSDKQGALTECPPGCFPVKATLTFKVPKVK